MNNTNLKNAPSSKSKFLAAVMNGKTLLVSACAISLACGYIAGKAGFSSGRKNEDPPSAKAQPERTRGTAVNPLLDSILSGRPIGEIPAADLAAIIARLSTNNPDLHPLARAKQAYQLQLLLEKLSTDDLAAIATAIQSDPEAKKSDAASSVLLELADRDPDRALAWLAAGEKPNDLFDAVFVVIARNDPMAAPGRLRKALLDESVGKSSVYSLQHKIAYSMARLGANPVISYMNSVPNSWSMDEIGEIMNTVPESERVRLIEGLCAQDEQGKLRSDGEVDIASLFLRAFASDEKGSREWFSKQSEEQKGVIRFGVACVLFGQGEKEAAAEWIREAFAANPGKEKEFIRKMLTPMIYGNSENIPFLARLLPPGVEFTAMDFHSGNHSNNLLNEGVTLTNVAGLLRDPGEQARLIADALESYSREERQLHRLNAIDFEILSRRIAAMGFAGENATLVNRALDAARNTKTIAD